MIKVIWVSGFFYGASVLSISVTEPALVSPIEKASNPHHFYHPTAVSDHFSLPDRSFHQGHRTHSIRTN